MTTARQIERMSLEEVQEVLYLFLFEDDVEGPKYSIAVRKKIVCCDEDVVVGATLRVKDGPKTFLGTLLNIGPKEQLESLMAIQMRNLKTPEGLPTKGDQDTRKRRSEGPFKKPKAARRIQPVDSSSDDESAESEEEKNYDVEDEMRKFSALAKKIRTPDLPSLSKAAQPDMTVFIKKMDEMQKTIVALNSELSSLKQKKEQKADTVGLPAKVETSSPGRMSLEHEGFNLLSVATPPKDPAKCALKLMAHLFSDIELRGHLLYKVPRSTKEPLDPVRVSKMFEALEIKYPAERVEKERKHIIAACNQKCRDINKRLKEQQNK